MINRYIYILLNINNRSIVTCQTKISINYRLLAAPLVVEGSEKTTSQYSTISGNLTLASLEIVECLVDANNANSHGTPTTEFVELLAFAKESTANIGFSNKTDFRMRFKYMEKAVRHAHMTKFTHPRTEIE